MDPHPFVPEDEALFDARAREILSIQATGLARRMLAAGDGPLVIGLSGGLDSTLAFLVCLDALNQRGLPLDHLKPLTLPGPGTSQRTLASARNLAEAAGVSLEEIPIAANSSLAGKTLIDSGVRQSMGIIIMACSQP